MQGSRGGSMKCCWMNSVAEWEPVGDACRARVGVAGAPSKVGYMRGNEFGPHKWVQCSVGRGLARSVVYTLNGRKSSALRRIMHRTTASRGVPKLVAPRVLKKSLPHGPIHCVGTLLSVNPARRAHPRIRIQSNPTARRGGRRARFFASRFQRCDREA